MLVALLEHAEVLADVDQRTALVGELEAHPIHFACVVAPALRVLINDDLGDGGGLVAIERREVHVGVPILGHADVVRHVGEAELRELGEHHVLGDLGAFGASLLGCLDRCGDPNIPQQPGALLFSRLGAVAGPSRGLGGV